MHHIQESVFVGEITDKDYKVIKQGLNKIIDPNNDRVIFYHIPNVKALKVEMLGLQYWIENVL